MPVVISALQIAYSYNRFANWVLSSALCNVPIVIINLQSAYWYQNLQIAYCHHRFSNCLVINAFQRVCCHQRFAKCLLLSAFCKMPTVINASQSKLKEWNRNLSLGVLLAVTVNLHSEDVGSIFLWNPDVSPQHKMSLSECCNILTCQYRRLPQHE